MKKMFLIFSHKLTDIQINSARNELGVELFEHLPPELQHIWSQIPPNEKDINPYTKKIIEWLDSLVSKDDYVLVQGDYGATFNVVNYCKLKDYKTVYSTTKREATEIKDRNGTIHLIHKVSHVMFREYQI